LTTHAQSLKRTLWIALALGMAAILPCLDLPEPAFADLFYSGAAINLATTGELRNPLLDGQGFPTTSFFVYPPFYPFVLSAWLRIASVGTWSLLYFQVITYFGAALFAALALVPSKQRPASMPILLVLLCTALLGTGFRADGLGVMALFAAFACLSRRGAPRWLGYFLVFAVPCIQPRLVFFAFGGALFLSRERTLLLREVIGVGTALLAVAFLFLWAIDFRLKEFVASFLLHGQGRRGGLFVVRSLANFPSIAAFSIAILAPLGVWLYCGRPRTDQARHLGGLFGAFGAAFVLTAAAGYGTFNLGYAVLAPTGWSWMEACIDERGASAVARVAVIAALVGAFVITNTTWITDRIVSLTGRARVPGPSYYADIRRSVEAFNPVRISVDSGAARYVYDYHLPANTLDFMFRVRFPGQAPQSASERPPGEVWLLTRYPNRFGLVGLIPPLEVRTGLRFRAFDYTRTLKQVFTTGLAH
jgi:hypothetical protein